MIDSKPVSATKTELNSSLDFGAALMEIASIEKVIAELQAEFKSLKDILLNNQSSSV